MNKENLHELIKRYEVNFDRINSAEHDEIFKWKVVKCFRDVWFGEAYKELSFAKRFHLATKDSSVLINNSMISPTNGVVKLAEEYPAEVETLFAETLFSGETDPVIVQAQMDRFLEEMERMRQQKLPSYYRYKQERHAASCYLAFFHPEVHYIYRYSEAEEFAKYIEFGKNLGAGADFSLPNYYEMADLVVEALKEHPSLIERHEKFIEDAPKYYRDKSLHLMAFDLMYCCRCYNFYTGLSHATKKESLKAYTQQQARQKEEQERLARIQQAEDELHALDVELEQYDDISLLDVEVTLSKAGTGIIVFHDHNMIKAQFPEGVKTFILHKKYPMRTAFENDEAVVDAYTRYAQLLDLRKKVQGQLDALLMK